MKRLTFLLCVMLLCNVFVFAESESVIKITSDKPGNIFFENDAISFTISGDASENTDLIYRVVAGEKIYRQAALKFNNKMNITLSDIPFGVYTFDVQLADLSANASVDFSYLKQGGEVSDEIVGMCTHFSQDKGDVDLSVDLLKNSGVKWIRDECHWGNVEKEKGVYVIPEKNNNYVNKALESGIQTLIVLDYGNSFYDGGNAPYTAEGREAFANYAKAVAQHFKGRVYAYEIWNEWSGGFGNPLNRSAEVYAQLLKVVYPAIKSVDPNIQVIAGATHNEGTSWFEEMLNSGAYDYFDAISYHPYCYPQNPDVKDYKGNIEDNRNANINLLRKYGGEKPVWLTEYGWHTSSASGYVSEKQQAEYMVRSYISGKAYGVDKIFWYDFQDDGIDYSSRENAFGSIRNQNADTPYSAKPSFVALSNMTRIVDGAEFVREYRPNQSIRAYEFYRKSDNKEIMVLYNALGGSLELEFDGNTDNIDVRDMFGNPCSLNCVSESPIYLVGNGIKNHLVSRRNGVSAVLGVKNNFDGLRGEYGKTAAAPDNETYGWTLDSSEGITFDVDDTFMFKSTVPVKLEVTYYDCGRDTLAVKYNVRGEDTPTVFPIVKLTNTNTWKKAEIIISNAEFKNDLDGHDLELIISDASTNLGTVISRVGIVKTTADTRFAFARLSDISRFENMSVRCGDNSSRLKYAQKNGRDGWITDIKNGFSFLYCDISDTYMYGSDYNLKIEVDYFDEGDGSFVIYYNGGAESRIIKLENTKTWKTAVFDLPSVNCKNSVNNYADFRISLWSRKMGTSSQDICFGAVRVTDKDKEESFGLELCKNEVKIDGYTKKASERIAVEILNIGKTELDLFSINSENVSENIVYANILHADKDGYYKCSFVPNMPNGQYLVRVKPESSENAMSKVLNYFNCFDVVNVKLTDRDNNVVTSIDSLDYVNVSMDFTSAQKIDATLVLAAYENGKLLAVNNEKFSTQGGESKNISLGLDLPKSTCKVKAFLIRDLKNIKPITKPIVFE